MLAVDENVFTRGVLLQGEEPATRVALASVMIAEGPRFSAALAAAAPAQITGAAPSKGDKIALVTVAGPLAQKAFADMCGYVDGYDRIAARFQAALNNPEVGAVILAIDSPGGDVAGLEEAVETMIAARDKSGKKCFVFTDELTASAAYWIASHVGNELTAPKAALVGSIGCVGALLDETEALKQEGLKVTLIRAPAGKAESHSFGPITELATKRATALIEGVNERFCRAVAEKRGLKAKAVEGFNGEVFSAPDALEHGLIDHVGSFETVLQRASAAIAERKQKMSEQEKAAKAAADNEKIAAAAKAYTGKESPDAVVGAFAGKAANDAKAEATSKALADAGIIVNYDAETKVATIVDTKREANEKAALIASLQADKKLAKTMVPWAESQSFASLKAFAEVAQPFGGPSAVKDAKSGDDAEADDPELEAELKKHGITLAEHRKLKAEQAKAEKG